MKTSTRTSIKLVATCVFVFTVLAYFSLEMLQTRSFYDTKAGKKPPIKYLQEQVQRSSNSERIDIFNRSDIEFVIRTTCHSKFRQITERWLYPSLRLFFLAQPTNWVVVFNEEEKSNPECAEYSKFWPGLQLRYQPGSNLNPKPYSNDRHRMFWSYFYPEQMTSATYIAWVDSDAMLVTPLIPEALVTNGIKPVVIARIGAGLWDYLCWSKQSEFFIGKKEAVQCMSYFPVVMKVQHVIEARKYIERRFNQFFDEIYSRQDNCQCQFSIICNYLWYFRREEYDWHLQIFPNSGVWKGELRQPSQVSIEYVANIHHIYKVPKPRVFMHVRHYLHDGQFMRRSNVLAEPHMSRLTLRLREGLCFEFGFEKCPDRCVKFRKDGVQQQLYEFEHYTWHFDSRCIQEQKAYYAMVKTYKANKSIKRNCSIFDRLL